MELLQQEDDQICELLGLKKEASFFAVHLLGGGNEKYEIVLSAELIRSRQLLVNVYKNGHEKMKESELGLKWTKNQQKLSLIKFGPVENPQEGSELAICNPVDKWSVVEGKTLNNGYWIGNLLTLTSFLTLKDDQQCTKSLLKVKCRVHIDGSDMNTTGGSGSIKLEGELPAVSYTPF